MAIASGGMGYNDTGPSQYPKWKKPSKGTKTVNAMNPLGNKKTKKKKKGK